MIQVSLGPEDIVSDGEGEPSIKIESIEQDVNMTDVSTAVCDSLVEQTLIHQL